MNSRYEKQTMLSGFGEEAQHKLRQASVLLVGAGGLGCPALQYLVAAGVGNLVVVDFDTVDISNLQRQVIYNTGDLGKAKAETAAQKMKALNPDVNIVALNQKLNNSNALQLVRNSDLVLDCSDNFATRYLLCDACSICKKPYVYGAVLRYEGQAGVFNVNVPGKNAVTYRHLFPKPPDPATVLSCNEAGVLGTVPGIIGTIQATEVIKLITGIGDPLTGRVLNYNALQNTFYTFEVAASEPGENHPNNETEFLAFDYEWYCAYGTDEISITEFKQKLNHPDLLVVDVREQNEGPEVNEFRHIHIPLSEIEKKHELLPGNRQIVLFCRSGQRSMKALHLLKQKNAALRLQSLRGGILAFKNNG